MLKRDEKIGLEAMRVFQDQFTQASGSTDYSTLEVIPPLVTKEENELMTTLPTMEEVKHVVFQLNGDSVAGPNRFTSLFF